MNRITSFIIGVVLLAWAYQSAHAQVLTFSITSPKAGECVGVGTPYTVKWSNPSVAPDHVALAYRADGQVADAWSSNKAAYFIEGAPNTGSYKWTPTGTATTSGRLTLEGHAVDHNIVGSTSSDVFSLDATPPDQPILKLKQKDATSLSLEWAAVADTGCATLSGYKLYRNDVLVDTLDATMTSYSFLSLPTNATYKFRLDAYDSVTSVASAALNVTLGIDPLTSPLPSNTPKVESAVFSKIKPADPSDTSIKISFEVNSAGPVTVDYGTTAKYGKTQSATLTQKTGVWTGSVTLSDLKPETTYHWRLRSKDTTDVEFVSPDADFKTKEDQSPPPSTPVVTAVSIGDTAVSIDPAVSAKIVEKEQIIISGTAEPKNTIVIIVHSTPQKFETTAGDDGKWSITLDTKGLEEGQHEVTMAVKSKAGKVGDKSPILHFQLIPKAQAAPLIFKAPDESKASQFGQIYGTVFLLLTVLGIVWLMIENKRQKQSDHFDASR